MLQEEYKSSITLRCCALDVVWEYGPSHLIMMLEYGPSQTYGQISHSCAGSLFFFFANQW